MGKDEILIELAKREDLKIIIFNIAGNDTYLKEELYQEIFIILCKKSDNWFNKFINKKGKVKQGRLDATVIKIAENQNKWTKCDFKNKIKKPLHYEDLPNNELIDEDSSSEYSNRFEDLKDIISLMKCCPRTTQEAYHSNILQVYLRNKNNITKAAKELGINKTYVRESIKFTKAKLKEEILKKSKNRNK